MKKRLLFAALFSAALVSCTKDQVVEVQQDEIKFRVATENATKAVPNGVYCNNNLFNNFNFIASYTDAEGTKTYIDKDEVEKTGTPAVWSNTTATRFWPNVEDCLDFYAYVNAGTVTTPTDWSVQTTPTAAFTVENTVSAQKDFVYAVAVDQDKTNGTVQLNFRHALSQIVFKAKNENPKLHLIVSGVEVHNAKNTGTFTFPQTSTTANYTDHGTVGTTNDNIENQGSWTSVAGSDDYKVSSLEDNNNTIEGIEVVGDGTVVNLTDATGSDVESPYSATYTNAMLLMPQTGSDWTLAVGETYTDPATTNIFFVLKCRIYNVAGAAFNSSTDVMLHGNSDGTSKEIYLPLQSFSWEQGKKYTYTFVLENGDISGGDDNQGDDILESIKYTVIVDDFKYGGVTDVELD